MLQNAYLLAKNRCGYSRKRATFCLATERPKKSHDAVAVRKEDRREGLLDREAALAPLNLGSDPFNTEAK